MPAGRGGRRASPRRRPPRRGRRRSPPARRPPGCTRGATAPTAASSRPGLLPRFGGAHPPGAFGAALARPARRRVDAPALLGGDAHPDALDRAGRAHLRRALPQPLGARDAPPARPADELLQLRLPGDRGRAAQPARRPPRLHAAESSAGAARVADGAARVSLGTKLRVDAPRAARGGARLGHSGPGLFRPDPDGRRALPGARARGVGDGGGARPADVLLFTGVAPVCALVVLLVARPAGSEARAYLAVAASVTVWLVAEVGVFASRHVGHLAERNLFALAPILFLALALWLDRGAPRPPIATGAAVAGALLLVAYLPAARFVSAATIPDALTLIPFHRLHVHAPGLGLRLVFLLVAGVVAAAFAFVPRRFAWLLPGALVVVFAGASVNVSRVVAAEASLVQPGTVGAHPRWVDANARGPVAYLYTGDVYWNSVWESLFWNRRLDRVYDLLLAAVPGGIPQDSLGPYADGRLVDKFGHGPRVRYVVASDSPRFVGRPVAAAGNGISLWQLDPPFRLRQWTQNVRLDGTVERHAKVFVYACRGGALRMTLSAPTPLSVELRRNERAYGRLRLRPAFADPIEIPAKARRPLGKHLCSFDLLTPAPVKVTDLAFRASA